LTKKGHLPLDIDRTGKKGDRVPLSGKKDDDQGKPRSNHDCCFCLCSFQEKSSNKLQAQIIGRHKHYSNYGNTKKHKLKHLCDSATYSAVSASIDGKCVPNTTRKTREWTWKWSVTAIPAT